MRTAERDGYDAVQLAFGEVAEKRLTKPEHGHFKKADAPPLRQLVEFRDAGRRVRDRRRGQGRRRLREGPDRQGLRHLEGQGLPGTVKRHNFSRGPVSHGSHNIRAPGSIGQAATPSRVFKGIRGPGQMGNKRVTQRGLEIVDVRADENLILCAAASPARKGIDRRDPNDGKAS